MTLAPNPVKRTAAIVIPDYAVRMAILDFEEFPTGEEERMALLRFRLRKTVPFHIEGAQLAYSIQVDDARQVEVLAVAIARPILEEYESIFAELGYRVGVVTPSSLATLRLCASPEKALTLLAKASASTVSVLLIEQSRIRLIRSLDFERLDEDFTRDGRTVLPFLQQTLAYSEDQIGQAVGRLLLCGFGAETETLGKLAEREFRLPYAQVRSRFGAISQENAGLLGLLEQYAA
jgi:type IV pilus assembly protein PilM